MLIFYDNVSVSRNLMLMLDINVLIVAPAYLLQNLNTLSVALQALYSTIVSA